MCLCVQPKGRQQMGGHPNHGFGCCKSCFSPSAPPRTAALSPRSPPGVLCGVRPAGAGGATNGGRCFEDSYQCGALCPQSGFQEGQPDPSRASRCWSISIRNGVRAGEPGVAAAPSRSPVPAGGSSSGAGLEAAPGRCREEEEEGAGGAGGRARPGNEGRRVGCCSQPLPSPPHHGPETRLQGPHPASQNPAAGAALGSFTCLPLAFYSVSPFRFILSWQ